MQAIQYYPVFCDVEPEVVEFSNLGELLNIDFVKDFSFQNGFLRYSYDNNLLIAEYEDGTVWKVVALLPDGNDVGLPEWEPVKGGSDYSKISEKK